MVFRSDFACRERSETSAACFCITSACRALQLRMKLDTSINSRSRKACTSSSTHFSPAGRADMFSINASAASAAPQRGRSSGPISADGSRSTAGQASTAGPSRELALPSQLSGPSGVASAGVVRSRPARHSDQPPYIAPYIYPLIGLYRCPLERASIKCNVNTHCVAVYCTRL